MSRRSKRELENSENTKLIIGVIVALAIITFIVSYILYSNRLDRRSKVSNVEKLSTTQNNMLNTIENTESSEVSSSVGKSVNEIKEETNTEKSAVNTSLMENNINNNATKSTNSNTVKQKKTETVETAKVETEKTEDNKEPTFIRPVDGEIIKDYSMDSLVYSNTLEEWTTHSGIDYAAEKTSIVKAAADGVIKSIKNDPRYGLTVVIEHEEGFTSLYANLLSTEFITVGEEVKEGQTIATVGNTATFEIADETHLHFEILKDGASVDPNIYIK